jgi:hypothetical protein
MLRHELHQTRIAILVTPLPSFDWESVISDSADNFRVGDSEVGRRCKEGFIYGLVEH